VRRAERRAGVVVALVPHLPRRQDGRPYIDNRPAPGTLGALRLPSAWLAHQGRQAAS